MLARVFTVLLLAGICASAFFLVCVLCRKWGIRPLRALGRFAKSRGVLGCLLSLPLGASLFVDAVVKHPMNGVFETGFTGLTGLSLVGNLVNPVNPVQTRSAPAASAQSRFAARKAANWNVRGAWKDSFGLPFENGWVFPWGTNHLAGVEVIAQGEVWATPFGDAVASLGVPVEIARGLSSFAFEHTPSNSYRFV